MEKQYKIIWDQKPPKKVEPAAQISARIITLNGPALLVLGKSDKLCLGVSSDKKSVFIKAYSKEMGGEVAQYALSAKQDRATIKCARFIADLGLELPPKKRLKCPVAVDEGMLVLSLA